MVQWSQFKVFALLISLLVQPVLGILKDDLFKIDWQTVQIGPPIKSIINDDQIITITELSVLAFLDINTGIPTYRYQSEAPFKATSKMLEIWDDLILTGFNFEDGKSKLISWATGESIAAIKDEIYLENEIIGLFNFRNEFLILVDRTGSIFQINKDFNIVELSKNNGTYVDSKIFQTVEGDLVVIRKELHGNSEYQVVSELSEVSKPATFDKCSFASITVLPTAGSIMCGDDSIYEFESVRGFKRVMKGSQLVTESFSVDSLEKLCGGKAVLRHQIVDSRYLIVFSEESMFLYDIDSSAKRPILTFEHFISFENVLSFEAKIKDDNIIQLFLAFSDLDLIFVENGDMKWSRDESLAYIIDSVVIDEQEELDTTIQDIEEEENLHLLSAYIQRLSRNYGLIFGGKAEKKDLNKHFGYTKKLVVLTENGKLFAFNLLKSDSQDQLLWQCDLLSSKGRYKNLYHIENRLLLLDNDDIIHELDVLQAEQGVLDLLPVHPGLFTKHFKVAITPEGGRKIFQTTAEELYISQITEDAKQLIGSHISSDNTQTSTWTYLVSDYENEAIIGVKSRDYGNDKVATNAIVLSGRKLLYKYLVPNLAVLVTHNKETNELKIKLINVITGQTYQTFKSSTDNPDALHLIFEENFIILSTTERGSEETILTTIDLFESLTPDLKKSKDVIEISAFNNTIFPEFEIKSYTLPYSTVVSMTTTKTKYNITSKWIILKLKSGEVRAIPRFILSGHRPVQELDAAQKQEYQLLRYDPVIPNNERMTLSHYRKLLSSELNSNVISVPTELESTSFVISFDLDTFVTLVRPSGSFDSMTSDFNGKILILTMVVLVLGILITQPMVESKKLKDAWQVSI
ncbi:hypothetical protein CANARDRAFT_28010 [[Candida] arabinofermentans NRRL YB-2248]|uniref:ER membrane protein complex subunit 1 n=1 Tax=[Candida] arabinofermentans NRRL YB-2248 TaxID=983967 RepID=A0A1E4T2G9_9ASCO|nr:hypothetical protein CANARDRAFT_28010 [[Candida] arabinofermentans NRRL YB-2248]